MAAKIACKDSLAEGCRLVGAHAIKPEPPPCFFRPFDDEGRRIGIKLIRVYPDPAVLRCLEYEAEGVVKFLMRPEPEVLADAKDDVRLECTGICRAHARINAIGADNYVKIFVTVGRSCLGFELKLHSK